MADTVDRPPRQRRGRLVHLASRAVDEHLVADAPADLDEVMQTVAVAPGWVRLLVLLAALALSWALIVLVVVALGCSLSQSKPRRVAPGEASTAENAQTRGKREVEARVCA